MVPLIFIGGLKRSDELRAYVIRFLPGILLVRETFPFHKVPGRVVSSPLGKQGFNLTFLFVIQKDRSNVMEIRLLRRRRSIELIKRCLSASVIHLQQNWVDHRKINNGLLG